jgi:Zn-dependent peptidase ImmA (M78 family)
MTQLWFGKKYPQIEDMVASAEQLGAKVTWAHIGQEAIFFAPDASMGEPPVIVLPLGVGSLRMAWLMAHELGHLVHHSGYVSRWTRDRQESQATRWAARALIPESAVQRYRNASVDAFIGALSKHYEDIPFQDCPERDLAAHIARVRLGLLQGKIA